MGFVRLEEWKFVHKIKTANKLAEQLAICITKSAADVFGHQFLVRSFRRQLS
jgi:hypothetical protein